MHLNHSGGRRRDLARVDKGFDFANHIENGLRVHTGGGRISAVMSADQFSD